MKFLLFLLSLLLVLTFPTSAIQARADGNVFYYAKVLGENTYFYETCNENTKLFEIPPSYFVMLTADANEEFYSAKYGDCLGFVKKNTVTPMNGKPTKPYACSYNFRITSMSGLSLMSDATFESESLASLDFLEDNVKFYGKLQGQEFFPNSTDVWYYCSFTKANETRFGYVFSYYCDFESKVQDNNEYFEEITETLSFSNDNNAGVGLSDTITAIIILAVVIPLLIIGYFFITPKNKKHKPVKVIKRHKDYYELSESDLN